MRRNAVVAGELAWAVFIRDACCSCCRCQCVRMSAFLRAGAQAEEWETGRDYV